MTWRLDTSPLDSSLMDWTSHSDIVFHFSPVIAKVTNREAKWTSGSQLDSYWLVFYTAGIPGSILYPCSALCFVPWSYSVVFSLRVWQRFVLSLSLTSLCFVSESDNVVFCFWVWQRFVLSLSLTALYFVSESDSVVFCLWVWQRCTLSLSMTALYFVSWSDSVVLCL